MPDLNPTDVETAVAAARRAHYRHARCLFGDDEADDAIDCAVAIALTQAQRDYDPTRGASLGTFLHRGVRTALHSLKRGAGHEAVADFRLRRQADSPDLVTGWGAARTTEQTEGEVPDPPTAGGRLGLVFVQPEPDPADQYVIAEGERRVAAFLASLPDRERQIATILYEGVEGGRAEAARQLHLSRERVRQLIEKRIKPRLVKADLGVDLAGRRVRHPAACA